MSVDLRYFSLGALLLLHEGAARAEALQDSTYGFSTARYSIEMRVSFPAPYEGKRLVVYRSTDPGKEVCLSVEAGDSGCTEKFVGALAFVAFTVNRVADGRSAAASIREVVTLVDQSPGMPNRPPFTMSIRLVEGLGSDVQVFGYDESRLPPVRRAAEREVARAAWRRYRQELYMDKDRQPFAVVEWLHTTTRIRIERVDPPLSQEAATNSQTPHAASGTTVSALSNFSPGTGILGTMSFSIVRSDIFNTLNASAGFDDFFVASRIGTCGCHEILSIYAARRPAVSDRGPPILFSFVGA